MRLRGGVRGVKRKKMKRSVVIKNAVNSAPVGTVLRKKGIRKSPREEEGSNETSAAGDGHYLKKRDLDGGGRKIT